MLYLGGIKLTNVVLGIDQSIRATGAFVSHFNKHSVIETEKNQKDDHLDVFFRSQWISKEILSLIIEYEVTHVSIEALPMKMASGASFKDLAALQGIIICDILRSGYIEPEKIFLINPATLKKYASGKGNANKQDMFDSLPEEYKTAFGSVPKSRGRYDLTDAYFLSRFIEDKIRGK